MNSFTFPKKERLRGRKAIKAVFKQGTKTVSDGITLFVLPNNFNRNRFLCTFRRGFGSAVLRNRTRRVFTDIYRHSKYRLNTGYDIVLLIFSTSDNYYECREKLNSLFKKSGMYSNEVL